MKEEAELPQIDLKDHHVVAGGEVMPNGEIRCRLMKGGVGYILTEAGEGSGWQNAHYHKGVMETCIVQEGVIIFVEEKGGERSVRAFHAGAVFTTEVGVPHNVFMADGATIHTVKHGVAVGNPDKADADWYPADEDFDLWTKSLSLDDLLSA